jgi:long-chain acyl-CoA synthetase
VNLARLVEDHVEHFGDYENIFFEGRWYTSGEAVDRVRRVAAGLQELGVAPGERVAVMLPNCPEVGITYWATWRIGGAVTPIVFLLPPPEINRILSDSEAIVAVTSSELLPAIVAGAEGVSTLKSIVSIDPADGTIAFTDLETSGEADMIERDPDDLAALLYTGGTTGASKGVMLSHDNLEWTARAAAEASEVKPNEPGVLALPLSHSFGLHVSILNALNPTKGALLRWFDPTQMLDLIQEHRVQRTAVVPTMLQMMLPLPLEDWDLSSLQYITSGAAPLPDEILNQWETRVPSSKLLQGYGLTETSPTIAVQSPSSAREGTRVIGSVGPTIPGVEVRIASDEGESLPPGEVGEITVRGPNVMLGYWRNEEATSSAKRDGWFHTGDVGRIDEKGNLWIVDRVKDLIIRGGFNVYPVDVEAAILQHPDVAEAGVVGRPSDTWGEEPVVFVVPAGGATIDSNDILKFCEERLAKYKRPVEVIVLDMLPKTPIGKIDKKELRTRLGS